MPAASELRGGPSRAACPSSSFSSSCPSSFRPRRDRLAHGPRDDVRAVAFVEAVALELAQDRACLVRAAIVAEGLVHAAEPLPRVGVGRPPLDLFAQELERPPELDLR